LGRPTGRRLLEADACTDVELAEETAGVAAEDSPARMGEASRPVATQPIVATPAAVRTRVRYVNLLVFMGTSLGDPVRRRRGGHTAPSAYP
jgi:hypothetical protein